MNKICKITFEALLNITLNVIKSIDQLYLTICTKLNPQKLRFLFKIITKIKIF